MSKFESLIERGVCRSSKYQHLIASKDDTVVVYRNGRSFTVCRACEDLRARLVSGTGKTGILLSCTHVVVFQSPWPQIGEMLYCRLCEEWQLSRRYTNVPIGFRA